MKHSRSKPPWVSTAVFVLAFVSATLAPKARRTNPEGGFFVSPRSHASLNGVSGGQQIAGGGGKGLTEFQAMLWKYVARCALPVGEDLEAPEAGTGKKLKFPGTFGVAPEWRKGTCDRACQEKVSSCLIALTNRTGKHVLVSVVSGDPSMAAKLSPDENDLGFPHQEGTFFGNVFSQEAFTCRGRDAHKAAQVKRFCVLEPATCSGIANFVDAGRCVDVCQMSCARLSDGTERCAARSCKDPTGRQWDHPVTTYVRNRIEAVNADSVVGISIEDDGVDSLDRGDSLTFKGVDFGGTPGAVSSFVASIHPRRKGGRIEVWLDGRRRIAVLEVKGNPSATAPLDQTAALAAGAWSGPHTVTLKIAAGKNIGRISTFELR